MSLNNLLIVGTESDAVRYVFEPLHRTTDWELIGQDRSCMVGVGEIGCQIMVTLVKSKNNG